MCANSEGSGYTVRKRRLAWAFAGRLCDKYHNLMGECGGSVVECRTPEREVRGSRPTAAVLCPWARHFTPRKYWLITQEAMAPSRHDWKIVDWDVKPQHNQPTIISWAGIFMTCLHSGQLGVRTHDRWIEVRLQIWCTVNCATWPSFISGSSQPGDC